MSENTFTPHPGKVTDVNCITLIGMAASGKTTIGRELSKIIDWPVFDSDCLIESTYGVPLQTVTDAVSKKEFLDMEAQAIQGIMLKRAIISTGGSVVYRDAGMQYLLSLGPIIYINVALPIILERIARKPDRGLAIAPGQTVEDLYNERAELYVKYASWTVQGGEAAPSVYAQHIANWLEQPNE